MKTLTYRHHAAKRMAEYGVTAPEVEDVVRSGEVIELYTNARPYPSRLILDYSGRRPLQVVASTSPDGEETFVITVYEPSPDVWEPDWKTRREKPKT